MLSHPRQLQIHSVHQKVLLPPAVFSKNPSSPEIGNIYIAVGDGASEGAFWSMKAADIVIDEEHYRKVGNAKDIDTRTQYSSKPTRQPGSAKTIL